MQGVDAAEPREIGTSPGLRSLPVEVSSRPADLGDAKSPVLALTGEAPISREISRALY